MYDAIIVGAGPAGLSAALVLGRCRRRVLVCGAGRPRNAASRAMHGFLSRDGIEPLELLRIAREQLRPYDNVHLRDVRVTDARRGEEGFTLMVGEDVRVSCRKLILATGLVDNLPRLEGFDDFYGRSVFHCPYCDGWEVRGRPLAAYGPGEMGMELALELTGWSDDLILCTDGPAGLSVAHRDRLARHGIELCEERVLRLEGTGGILERVVFAGGGARPVRALFFDLGWRQHSDLPRKLGCRFTPKDAVEVHDHEATNVPGLFVVGDAAEHGGYVMVAAAQGARAATAVNRALLKEDLARVERAAGGGAPGPKRRH